MPSKPIPTAHQDIHAVLERVWGYTQFRPKQEEIIRSVLAGKDTMALLPTGGGKSICFQVPALAMGRMCLVISPLIALMKDQVSRLKKQGVAARAIVSSMRPEEIDNALESAALGKYAFLYVSPERLASELFKARLPRLPLGLIAVDEAHCISQWGYDFRPAYLNIAEVRIVRPDVPVIALTASATPQVAADIMQRLAFAKPTLIRGSFYRPELTLWLSRSEDKQGRLLRIFHHVPGTAIVYVRDRRSTIRIANFLSQHGISAAGYHAGLPPEERDRIQQEWTSGQVRCIVATNAFGMGIDKADVRAVVHMEPPADLESYYQEAGRAGRDGRSSYAFLLTGPGDVERMEERLLASFPALEHVRKVYQAFANLHGIALGSGLLQAYAVELQELVTRTKLPPLTITHSLKALELDGKLSLSDGLRTPSRVLILADQRVVYGIRLNDTRLGPVMETLLRMYGGLYEEPVVIDEHRMARAMEWQASTVISRLKELDRQKVIAYRQRSDSPTATLLLPRLDASRLTLDPAALATRKQRATERMAAMIGYMEGTTVCRAKRLIHYFGEEHAEDCGICDICQARVASNLYTVAKPLINVTADVDIRRWNSDEEEDNQSGT